MDADVYTGRIGTFLPELRTAFQQHPKGAAQASRFEMDNIRGYPMEVGDSYLIPLKCQGAADA